MLLRAAFDADSLGKWIFDWAVKIYGTQNLVRDVAADLWLELIRFYGEIKTSEEFVHRNEGATDAKSRDAVNLLQSFLYDAESLLKELERLIEQCEEPMREAKRRGKRHVGKESARAFMEILLGRDELLEETEKFIQGMRYRMFKLDKNWAKVMKRHGEAERS